jgi:hypothetical protein
MKLFDLIKLFKWPDYKLEVRADTSDSARSQLWYGNLADFAKENPINDGPYSQAKDNHLGNYQVRETEANDGKEDLITVYIKGRTKAEFYEEGE